MTRICIALLFIICAIWACNKEAFEIQKPITAEITPSVQIEHIHDSAVKDLEQRIKFSEDQIKELKKHSVTGPKKLHMMSASDPIQYKADNPPE